MLLKREILFEPHEAKLSGINSKGLKNLDSKNTGK